MPKVKGSKTSVLVPEKIILAAISGDIAAFEELQKTSEKRIYHYLLSGLYSARVWYVTEAEDLTQEVFIAAWLNIGKFDPEKRKGPSLESSFKNWLFTIAKNKLNKFLSTVKRRPFSGEEYEKNEWVATQFSSESIDNLTLTMLLAGRLTLKEGSQLQSWANALSAWDYQVKEIAFLLGDLSQNNVRLLRHRSRKQLTGSDNGEIRTYKDSLGSLELTRYPVLTSLCFMINVLVVFGSKVSMNSVRWKNGNEVEKEVARALQAKGFDSWDVYLNLSLLPTTFFSRLLEIQFRRDRVESLSSNEVGLV